MSGRGLGHTGGTVDKLESIPGYRTELSIDEFLAQSRRVGLCLIGQSKDLAPADKRLYALRDVTSTVDSVPLITSSVMSKKLAAGASAIVLDVTVGSGAFMKTPEDASVLAKNMVEIGRRCGRKMTALITNMDEPLGFAIGNSLEVQEAVSVLKGQLKGDVYEVSLALAAEQLALVFELAPEKARALAEDMVSSGKAFAKMKEWVAAQGGDVRYLDEPERFPRAAFTLEVPSPRDGFVCRMDTEAIGNVAGTLGAGRARAEDAIDFAAGIVLKKKDRGSRPEGRAPVRAAYRAPGKPAAGHGAVPAGRGDRKRCARSGEADPRDHPLKRQRQFRHEGYADTKLSRTLGKAQILPLR